MYSNPDVRFVDSSDRKRSVSLFCSSATQSSQLRLAPNDALRFVGLRVCRPGDASSCSKCSLCGNAEGARTTQRRCEMGEQQFIQVMSIDVRWAFLHHAGRLLWEMWPLRSKRRLSIHLRSMQARISKFLCVRSPVEGTSKRISVKKTLERKIRGW